MSGSEPSLFSFFSDFYSEADLIRSFKETDVDRIKKKNKVPLRFTEEHGWIKACAPFSFQVIMDVIFNCVGDVITLNKTDDISMIRKDNSVEMGFYKLSQVSEVFYKLPCNVPPANNIVLRNNVTNEQRKWHDTAIDSKVEILCCKMEDLFYLSRVSREKKNYIPSKNHVKLAITFFGYPPHQGKWEEFYYSLFPPTRFTGLRNDSFFKKRRLAIIFDPHCEGFPLAYGISEKKIVYIDGCPCNISAIPRYIKETHDSTLITSLYKLGRAFTDKFIEVPAHYKRFSRVISMLCHLELFGQSCNEKEVALKMEEMRHGISCEDSISKVRKPSPWNLNHRTSLISNSNDKDHRSDFETTQDPNGGKLHVSPFDSIKWQEDLMCMLRGYAFVDQHYVKDFSSSLSSPGRKAYTFLAFAYAFLSQMLTTSTFCYTDLKYRNNRPLLESYEWWITYDGLLYYKRETDERKKLTDGKYRIAPVYTHDEEKQGTVEADGAENTTTNCEKPFFLQEQGTNKTQKRYTNTTRNRKMDPNLFPDAEGDSETTNTEVGTIIGANLSPDFDPFKLRKYDGIGRFPYLVGEEELQQKINSRDIMYSFDQMDQNGIPFVLNSFEWDISNSAIPKSYEQDAQDFSVDSFQPAMDMCVFYLAICKKDMHRSTESITIVCPSVSTTCKAVADILLLKNEKLLSAGSLWMSNPLWIQACLYVVSKEDRYRFIMRTAPNVPERFDDICFSATFIGQWKYSHTILLGYVEEDLSCFTYDIFWCSMTFQDTTFVAKKMKLWRVRRLNEKKLLKSRRENKEEIKMEEISMPEFDELLKRSVLFIIDDEFA